MARRARFQHPNAIYHVTANGVNDQPIYLDVEDRDIWILTLGNAVTRFSLDVYAWCEMTSHNHLLLRAPQCNLDVAMKWLMGVYAQGLNKRHRRRGPLYRDRYSSWLIQSDEHFLRTARYIALNPVKEFMCTWPGEWRWSSYVRTVNDTAPWPANRQWEILKRFGADPAEARKAYRAFVEAGLPLTRAA